jgi:hypothetical protein
MAFTEPTTAVSSTEPEPCGERSAVLGLRLQSVALAVLAVLALIAVRTPFLDGDLLKCDEAIYGVTARAWTQGLLPGRDVWDNKPPGMAALYLLASHLPGETVLGSRLLALLFSALTLLVMLRLARLVAPRLQVWPVATAYLLITQANGWFPAEWVTLNGELPSTCLVALSVWCAAEWTSREDPRLWPLLVLCGSFSGTSVLFRQTAALPVVAIVCWFVWVTLRNGSREELLKTMGQMALGWAVACLPLAYHYWSQGALQYLWPSCFGLGMAYAGQGVAPVEAWRSLREALSVAALPALVGLGGIGVAFGIGRIVPRGREAILPEETVRPLVAAWAVGSAVSVLPGGHLFGHYFLQTAPAWALAAGLGVARLRRFPPGSSVSLAGGALLALGLLLVAGRLWVSQPMGPVIACLWLATSGAAVLLGRREPSVAAWCGVLFLMLLLATGIGSNVWQGTRVATADAKGPNQRVFGPVVAEIRARTSPADRILVWAWAPQIYWYSDRLPASRDITLNYSLGWIGKQPQELLPGAKATLLRDLNDHRPRVIVVANDDVVSYSGSPAWKEQAAPEVWGFIGRNYRRTLRLPHWDLYEPVRP